VPEPLDEFARSDLLLDALAQRRPVHVGDSDMDAMAVLLGDWRDNLRWPPASALVSREEAVEALRTGLAERRRGRRGLATIGSVAAALLVMSGFGAMVVEARPGDALYGLHAMFYDQPRVNDQKIELSAKAELAKVQQLINQGQWAQAHSQLAEVSSAVQSMNDGASRNDLMDQVNLLNTRVESRDPNATLPPPQAVTPAPQTKPPKAPAASTTPSASSTPSTTAPTAVSPSTSSSTSPTTSTTPSSSHHHHHGQTSTPSSAAPGG
jgi:anti-sigma-D factor RsdA-like protein